MEFIVFVPGQGVNPEMGRKDIPQDFVISHENLETSTTQKIPKFKFEGKIYTVNCNYAYPFDGFVIKKESELLIKSLEIQLVRVETFQDKTSATEVQNIQVADGDCLEDIEIPTYMLFPKMFSSTTFKHKKFKIEYQVNVIVIFSNGYQLTENVPINIYR